MINLRCIAFSLATLPVLATSAQGTPFAIQATVSMPHGDLGGAKLMNGKIGFGLGFRWQVGLGTSLDLVPRADYARFTRKQDLHMGTAHVRSDFRANIIYIGADLNWFPAGRSRQGFYLLGGAGYSAASLSQSTIVADQGIGAFDPVGGSRSAPYLAAGFGGQVDKNFNVEFRYLGFSKYSFSVNDLKASSLNFSAVFRY